MQVNDFLERINKVEKLPGIQAHKKLMPKGRPFSREEVKNIATYRLASVGIVCFPSEDDEVGFLLIERPVYEGAHSGQMAFPGGKKDDTDADLLMTAKREVQEEVGLMLKDDNLYLELTEMLIPVSQFIVQPYLFFVPELTPLILDPREVNAVFSISIDELLAEENFRKMTAKVGELQLKNVPYYHLSDKYVWGATAIILSELKAILTWE